MTQQHKLIKMAQGYNNQFLRLDYSDGTSEWRAASQMPNRGYWDDVLRMLKNAPRLLVVEERGDGVFIDRITPKGTPIGLGKKNEKTTKEMHDGRFFSDSEELPSDELANPAA